GELAERDLALRHDHVGADAGARRVGGGGGRGVPGGRADDRLGALGEGSRDRDRHAAVLERAGRVLALALQVQLDAGRHDGRQAVGALSTATARSRTSAARSGGRAASRRSVWRSSASSFGPRRAIWLRSKRNPPLASGGASGRGAASSGRSRRTTIVPAARSPRRLPSRESTMLTRPTV